MYLSPPDDMPNGMQISVGVVLIKLWNNNIRSINIRQPSDAVEHFSSIQRNALCEQMGFIGAVPDSVYSVSALKNRFNFTKIEERWVKVHYNDVYDFTDSSGTPGFPLMNWMIVARTLCLVSAAVTTTLRMTGDHAQCVQKITPSLFLAVSTILLVYKPYNSYSLQFMTLWVNQNTSKKTVHSVTKKCQETHVVNNIGN